MRQVVAVLYVDDDRAIKDDMGTIDYLEREFGRLLDSGIFLENARVIDDDDNNDKNVIELTNKIFMEE